MEKLMDKSVKNTWNKFWDNKLEIPDSKIFNLIELSTKNYSENEKIELIEKPMAIFRSVSILYRWLYYHHLRGEESKPVNVMTIDPRDLPELKIKDVTKIFNSGTKANKDNYEFLLGKSLCPKCGKANFIEDNREKKKNNSKFAKIPDFSCSNYLDLKGCGWGGYINSYNSANKVPESWVGYTNSKIKSYGDDEKKQFEEWCLNQIQEVAPNLLKTNVTYNQNNSKIIKNYWNNPEDQKIINNYRTKDE